MLKIGLEKFKKYKALMVGAIVVLMLISIGIFAYGMFGSDFIAYRYEKGQSLNYLLEFESGGKTNDQGVSATKLAVASQKSSVVIKGSLTFNIVGKDESGKADIIAVLVPTKYDFEYNGSKSSFKDPIRFGIRIDKYGVIENYSLDKKDYEDSGNTIRELLAFIELPLLDGTAKEWIGREKMFPEDIATRYTRDGVGVFTGVTTVQKTYVNKNPSLNITGSGEYRFNGSLGHLDGLDGTRKVDYLLAGQLISSNTAIVKLQKTSVSSLGEDQIVELSRVLDASKELVTDTLSAKFMRSLLTKKTLENALQNDDFKSISILLNKISVGEVKELSLAVMKLTALLVLHPETTKKVGELMRKYAWNDSRRLGIQAALAKAGTPESQGVLIEAAKHAIDGTQEHSSLMFNIAFSESPGAPVEQYLREKMSNGASEDTRIQASWGLGTVAHNVKQEQPERAKVIYNEAIGRLNQASTDVEKIDAIKMLGNIGLSEQYGVMSPLVDSGNLAIKSAAIDALRFVNTQDGRQKLLENVKDNNEAIREASLKSLALYDADSATLEIYRELLFKETSVTVANQLIDNIAKMNGEFPVALSILDSYISICGKTDICNHAKSVRETLKPISVR